MAVSNDVLRDILIETNVDCLFFLRDNAVMACCLHWHINDNGDASCDLNITTAMDSDEAEAIDLLAENNVVLYDLRFGYRDATPDDIFNPEPDIDAYSMHPKDIEPYDWSEILA